MTTSTMRLSSDRYHRWEPIKMHALVSLLYKFFLFCILTKLWSRQNVVFLSQFMIFSNEFSLSAISLFFFLIWKGATRKRVSPGFEDFIKENVTTWKNGIPRRWLFCSWKNNLYIQNLSLIALWSWSNGYCAPCMKQSFLSFSHCLASTFAKKCNDTRVLKVLFFRFCSPKFGGLGREDILQVSYVATSTLVMREILVGWFDQCYILSKTWKGKSWPDWLVKSACEPSGPSVRSLSRFPWHEATRSISVYSPLDGMPVHRRGQTD